MPEYEIEPVWFKGCHHETIIGILTGLPRLEIDIALKSLGIIPPYPYDFKSKSIWFTRDYMNAFHILGFNTNVRFQKFDPETKYPCIMRCKDKHNENGYWYGWVYNALFNSHYIQKAASKERLFILLKYLTFYLEVI